jgi:hypothetical protein
MLLIEEGIMCFPELIFLGVIEKEKELHQVS